MTEHPNSREETIVPVRPVFGKEGASSLPGAGLRSGRWLVVSLFSLLAVAAVVVVFIVLPSQVERERVAREAQAAEQRAAAAAEAAAAAAATAEPELSAEERAALRDEAENLLAQLLTQQQSLEVLNPTVWAPERWQRYLAQIRSADDAMLADSLRRAVEDYAAALALGEALATSATEMVASALAAGRAAFTSGDAGTAIAEFDKVLAIDPEHAAAQTERANAEQLPAVLALVAAGDAARAAGDFDAASDRYEEALAILPWPQARAALRSLDAAIAAAAFDRAMSRGTTALAGEEFEAAAEQFRAALALRPDAQAALDGLAQSEQGQHLDAIALAEARALAFERRELWDNAIAQYRAALETDASLAFAQEGLQRSQVRASLDAKLANLIDNPNLLLEDRVLADATKLVAEAHELAEPGPRLSSQIGALEELIAVASTPLPVALRSDGMTEVTVYRVGSLGTFAEKALELRPGTYTAIGSRHGYRDVRQTFTVLPNRPLEPVQVVCVERI